MPVEIKELVIRAVVNYSSSGGEISSGEEGREQTEQLPDQSAIIKECVKQVMKIIDQKQKR